MELTFSYTTRIGSSNYFKREINNDFFELPEIRFFSELDITVIAVNSIAVSLSMNERTSWLLKEYHYVGNTIWSRASTVPGRTDVTLTINNTDYVSGVISDVKHDYLGHKISFTITSDMIGLKDEIDVKFDKPLQFSSVYFDPPYEYQTIGVFPIVAIRDWLISLLVARGYIVDISGIFEHAFDFETVTYDEYFDLIGGALGILRDLILSRAELPLATGPFIFRPEIRIRGQVLDVVRTVCVMSNSTCTVAAGRKLLFRSFPKKMGSIPQLTVKPADPVFTSGEREEVSPNIPYSVEKIEFFRGGSREINNLAKDWRIKTETAISRTVESYTLEAMLPQMVYPGDTLDVNGLYYKVKDVKYDSLLLLSQRYYASLSVTCMPTHGGLIDVPFGENNYA